MRLRTLSIGFILLASITVVTPSHAVRAETAACDSSAKFCALAPIPGLTDGASTSVVNADTLAAFLNNLYKYLIGVAATAAVIMIIWGGIDISTTDSIGSQSAGRARIKNAIGGLILVLMPVVVFSVINPSILNLSINLPALDTKASAPEGAKWTQPDGAECTTNDQCSSKTCDLSSGKKNTSGTSVGECSHIVSGVCSENSQCVTGFCDTGGGLQGLCKEKPTDVRHVFDGAPCSSDLECTSNICDFAGSTKVCLVGTNLPKDARCNVNRQCASTVCAAHLLGSYCN